VVEKTGYEFSFGQFLQVMREPSYRDRVIPFLREFGFRVEGEGEAASLYNSQNQPVAWSKAYERIEGEESSLYTFYRLAMTCWYE
jgi:hypothetical protein